MFNPIPQQKLHPAVRWRCQNPPEDLEGVWGCRGRQEELQVFPFSCPSPGRQAGLNTSIQDTTEKIIKFALQYGELRETGKEKGKKELRERPLFLLKNKAGSCRAGLSPCHPLASSRRAHLHWLLGLYSRHSSHNPQCPSKMFAVMLSRAILLCFDPFLTQELTLNCSMCRWGSKARNFQTQKKNLLSPRKKVEGKNKQTNKTEKKPQKTHNQTP